ncbi:conserved hypothetical protein [Ricinus communis]|uniref:Uncharacterized protein n=1 Tax=Ricinus communis TaxID=3988 RepID=B9SNL3_RICCO|nr:conserved hypothetical protein [Ricinus communis]
MRLELPLNTWWPQRFAQLVLIILGDIADAKGYVLQAPTWRSQRKILRSNFINSKEDPFGVSKNKDVEDSKNSKSNESSNFDDHNFIDGKDVKTGTEEDEDPIDIEYLGDYSFSPHLSPPSSEHDDIKHDTTPPQLKDMLQESEKLKSSCEEATKPVQDKDTTLRANYPLIYECNKKPEEAYRLREQHRLSGRRWPPLYLDI